MTTNYTASRVAYQRAAIMTASQGQLIVMLYDGAGRFLAQASSAMSLREIEDAHNKLRRAEMIINHLSASLDYERGGELSGHLAAIYSFCLRHLNQARLHADPEKIDQVRELMGKLRDAWAQITSE
jgi:flagellar protein FliS